MIYVVTGTQRSGTSMMMGCLAAGGLPVYYDAAKEDNLREKHPETNQGGYFEPTLEEMRDLHFPSAADGMVVKFHAPWRILGCMEPGYRYRVIIMRRDPREIVASLARFNNGLLTTGDLATFNRYYEYIDKAVSLVHNRRDVESVTIADYDDVLTDPLAFFQGLGWPIDTQKAASEVKPASRKVGRFDKPFSGDIAADLGIGQPMSIGEAIKTGRIDVPDEIKEAAERGAKFGLSWS